MKKKHLKTRHALLMSMISLMTCFAMLVGATFAWFTDSVTSGVNRIVAGNLDVEVYHSSTGTPTEAAENKVGETTSLFPAPTLWEPGAVSYENFLVKNAGTLALKYQLGLSEVAYNTVTRADGDHDLREVLKVAVVTGGFSGDREAAKALTGYVSFTNFAAGAAKTSSLEAGASEIFGVVMYWEPTTSDDLYNLNNGTKANANSGYQYDDVASDNQNKLYIDSKILLNATQYTSESDSFDRTYDAVADGTAVWAGVSIASATATVQNDGGSAVVSANIDANPANDSTKATTVTLTADDTSAAFASEDTVKLDVTTSDMAAASATAYQVVADGTSAVASIDLSLYVNDAATTTREGFTATIDTYIAKNLTNVVLQYNGTDTQNYTKRDSNAAVTSAGDYWYDATTGELVFMTAHFSEYVVTSDDVAYDTKSYTAYATVAEALAQDGTLLLLKDVALNDPMMTIEAGRTIVLDLNGHTISAVENRTGTAAVITNNGTLTIDDSIGTGRIWNSVNNPDMKDVPSYASNTITNNGTLTLNGGTIENCGAGYACFAIDNYPGGVFTMNGGVARQDSAAHYAVRMFCNSTTNENAVIINGGTITGGYAFWLQTPNGNANKASLKINGGTFIASDGAALYFGGSGSSTATRNYSNTDIVINGGVLNKVMLGGVSEPSKAPRKFDITGGEISELAVGAFIEPVITGGTYQPEYEAQVGDTKYLSFSTAQALAAGNTQESAQTVKLLKNVDGYLMYNDAKVHKLDLNGHNVTNYSGSGNSDTINVYKNTTLYLTDSSDGTKGVVSSEVGVAIWTGNDDYDNSKIEISGGVTLSGSIYCIQSSKGTTSITISDAVTSGTIYINSGSTLTDNRNNS